MTFLPVGRVEAAGTQEDVHHVEYAVVVRSLLVLMLAVLVLIMQIYIALAARIVVENLIHRISLAFAGTLAEIHRNRDCKSGILPT